MNPASYDEIIFWATHLRTWALLGCSFFPTTTRPDLRITGDAGPNGVGIITARLCYKDGVEVLDTTTGGERTTEWDDQWVGAEREHEHVTKELRTILCGLENALDKKGIMRDQGIDITTSHPATAAWMEIGMRMASATEQEHADILTDNEGCVSFLEKGGTSYKPCLALTKQIWMLCLANSIAPRARWVSGETMIGNGADGLSRLHYASQADWTPKTWVLPRVLRWHGAPATYITARDIASREAYKRDISGAGGFFVVAMPPVKLAAAWVGHCLASKGKVILLLPRTQMPWAATVSCARRAPRGNTPTRLRRRSRAPTAWQARACLPPPGARRTQPRARTVTRGSMEQTTMCRV
jgi:hypothetical protein